MLLTTVVSNAWVATKEISFIILFTVPLVVLAISHYEYAVGGMHYYVLLVLAYSLMFPYARRLHEKYVDFIYYSVILIGVVFTASEYKKNQWMNQHTDVQSRIEMSQSDVGLIDVGDKLEMELQELINSAPNWVSSGISANPSILSSDALIWLNGFALPYILCIGLSMKLARKKLI